MHTARCAFDAMQLWTISEMPIGFDCIFFTTGSGDGRCHKVQMHCCSLKGQMGLTVTEVDAVVVTAAVVAAAVAAGVDSTGGGGGGISDGDEASVDGGGGGEASVDGEVNALDSKDVAGDSGEEEEGDGEVKAVDSKEAGDSGEADEDDDEEEMRVMSQRSAPEPVSASTKSTMPDPTAELTPQALALRKVSQELRPWGRLMV